MEGFSILFNGSAFTFVRAPVSGSTSNLVVVAVLISFPSLPSSRMVSASHVVAVSRPPFANVPELPTSRVFKASDPLFPRLLPRYPRITDLNRPAHGIEPRVGNVPQVPLNPGPALHFLELNLGYLDPIPGFARLNPNRLSYRGRTASYRER